MGYETVSDKAKFPKPKEITGSWGVDENPELGVIKSVMLGIEDHGLFTFQLDINFGGTGQGFGTYCLDTYDPIKKERVGTAFGCTAILQLLRAVGVQEWKDLVGKAVWCYRNEKGAIEQIEAPAYHDHEGYLNMKELSEEFKKDGRSE